MSAKMLVQVLVSYLLYFAVYASPVSQFSPRDDHYSDVVFPTLENALIGVVDLGPVALIGQIASGATQFNVQIVGGSIDSVPGFTPPLHAVIDHGDDLVEIDNDGQRLRLNARIIIKNGEDFLSVSAVGIVTLTPEVQAILAGTGSTTPFGDIVITAKFQTGNPDLKGLENSIFVGSGRFLVNQNATISIQYGISEVLP